MLSGGLDSVTLLYYVVKRLRMDAYPVTFSYGQRHAKEIEYAAYHCGALGIGERYKVLDLNLSRVTTSAIMNAEGNVQIPSKTIVPARNMTFLSLAVGYAGSIGANLVYYGAHASDGPVYPDCRPEFVDAMKIAAQRALDTKMFDIVAPFIQFKKSDVVKLAYELGIDFKTTWTCYVGADKHCGKCTACIERRNAFEIAGVVDTAEYE